MQSPARPAQSVQHEPAGRSRAVAVVGVAIVVLVAAGIVAWRVMAAERHGPVPPAATGVEEVFTDLPAELRPPAQVADLPGDRGVGKAALMYHLGADVGSYDPVSGTLDQNDVYLVTRSGEHFRVGLTPAGTGPLDLSLSPMDAGWAPSRTADGE